LERLHGVDAFKFVILKGAPYPKDILWSCHIMTKTYDIPENRITGLQYRVNKLASRARKNGLFEPSFKVVDRFPKTVEVYDPLARVRGHESDVKTVGFMIASVEAGGFNPQLGEWNIVGFRYGRRINDQETVFSHWGDVPGHKHGQPLCCDHCGLKRRRSETFIVQRETDGNTVEVGTSCLGDFTGHDYSDSFLKSLSDAGRLMSEIEAAANWSLNDADFTLQDEIRNVLAVAVSIVRVDGFMNARDAESYNVPSTARLVVDELARLNGKNVDQNTIMVIHSDFVTADALLAHFNQKPVDHGFNDKVKLSIARGLASPADIGLLAGAVGSYYKDLERQRKMADLAPILNNSKPQGEIGEKSLRRVTVAQTKAFNGEWGVMRIVTFVDDESNLFVWKTSSEHEFEEGHRYEISGRVKAHSVGRYPPFKDVAQTELKNVTLKDHFGPAIKQTDTSVSDAIDDELESVLGF
jgi:hypothetical protein